MVRIDWAGYKAFLEKNNRKEYVCSRCNYAIKYQDCYSNPSKILSVPPSIRANILKAMVCLSKYLDRSIEVGNSKPVTYSCIRKYLQRRHIKLRLKELRSYYANYLRKHGIVSELVDLIQGRIGKDVFIRHYLKENPENLSNQVLGLLKGLENSIQPEQTLT